MTSQLDWLVTLVFSLLNSVSRQDLCRLWLWHEHTQKRKLSDLNNNLYLWHLKRLRVLSCSSLSSISADSSNGLKNEKQLTRGSHGMLRGCVYNPINQISCLPPKYISSWVFNKIHIFLFHLECGCSQLPTWFWLHVENLLFPPVTGTTSSHVRQPFIIYIYLLIWHVLTLLKAPSCSFTELLMLWKHHFVRSD